MTVTEENKADNTVARFTGVQGNEIKRMVGSKIDSSITIAELQHRVQNNPHAEIRALAGNDNINELLGLLTKPGFLDAIHAFSEWYADSETKLTPLQTACNHKANFSLIVGEQNTFRAGNTIQKNEVTTAKAANGEVVTKCNEETNVGYTIKTDYADPTFTYARARINNVPIDDFRGLAKAIDPNNKTHIKPEHTFSKQMLGHKKAIQIGNCRKEQKGDRISEQTGNTAIIVTSDPASPKDSGHYSRNVEGLTTISGTGRKVTYGESTEYYIKTPELKYDSNSNIDPNNNPHLTFKDGKAVSKGNFVFNGKGECTNITACV